MPVTKVRRVDFWPTDWIEGTICLDHFERSVYVSVCAGIYATGGPVSVDYLKRICPGKGFKRGLEGLLKRGKVTLGDGLVSQERCVRELIKSSSRLDASRLNGAKGGRPNDLDKPPGSFLRPRARQQLTTNKESLSSSSLPSSARAPGLSDGPDHARGNGAMRSIGDILGSPPPPPIPSEENLHAERQQQHARFLMARGSSSELELYWSAQMSDNADDGRRMFDLVEARMISDGWPP